MPVIVGCAASAGASPPDVGRWHGVCHVRVRSRSAGTLARFATLSEVCHHRDGDPFSPTVGHPPYWPKIVTTPQRRCVSTLLFILLMRCCSVCLTGLSPVVASGNRGRSRPGTDNGSELGCHCCRSQRRRLAMEGERHPEGEAGPVEPPLAVRAARSRFQPGGMPARLLVMK